MAEIVETEVAKFGGAAMAEEGFGDTVRFPRGDSVVVGEDIPVRWWRCDEGPVELGEHGEGGGVDVDGVRAFEPSDVLQSEPAQARHLALAAKKGPFT